MSNGEISTDDELVVKAQYINCMQDNTKKYWEQSPQKNNIINTTGTIVQPCLDVATFTKERKYQKVFAIKIKYVSLYKGVLSVLTDYDHDCILHEIKSRDIIEYGRKKVLMISLNEKFSL